MYPLKWWIPFKVHHVNIFHYHQVIIAQLRPYHQQSSAWVKNSFTWHPAVASHSLARPTNNLQSSVLVQIPHFLGRSSTQKLAFKILLANFSSIGKNLIFWFFSYSFSVNMIITMIKLYVILSIFVGKMYDTYSIWEEGWVWLFLTKGWG